MADGTDFNDFTPKVGNEAIKEKIEQAAQVKESDQETIARLAKLSTEEYEGRRKDKAKELNWRISILDKAVEKARIKLWAERRAAEQAERQEEEEQPVSCPDLGEEDHLVLVDRAIRDLGYGGDTKLPRLLYLSYTSRLLAFDIGNMLAHGQVVGASSSGKNYAVDTVLALVPVEAYLKIDAGSPKALIYCDEDLRHRIVVFTEADSLPIGDGGGKSLADGDSRSTAASALRNLASDGYLSYDIVERGPDSGQYVTRRIKKLGPTLLITTTTRAIEGQMGTRLWQVPMLESDKQIRDALDKRVSFELTRQRSIPEKLIEYQSYLQAKTPWDAIVPFARVLVEGMVYKGMDPRILRDFQRLLALIKAVTILRHQQREKDVNGRWLATIEDYAAVREVLNESYAATVNSGITEDVRKVVDAVGAVRAKGVLTVTYNAIATHLDWYTTKAYRKAKIALAHGWLVNQQTQPRQPADLIVGDPMPIERGLPTVEQINELSKVRI